jgi:hypothetical protein
MKTLDQIKTQLNEVQGEGRYVYGSDSKQVPDIDSEGRPVYRTVRARRIQVGKKAPSPIGISGPDVGSNDAEQDKDRTIDLFTKYYKKYIQALNLRKEDTTEINESVEEAPYVLVLKRKNIRMINGKIKVAVYHNEKLDKYFTVPIIDDEVAKINIQAEETITDERDVVSSLFELYLKLDEENKQMMIEMINNNENTYNKLKQFLSDNQ